MDDQTRDEETVAPQQQQRQRSSIPSFIFISFVLFMLTNHSSDEFVARTQYQDALASLQWQAGNFSAWLNGTVSTNFTIPEQNPTVRQLVDPLVRFGPLLDPSLASYYPNITGFIRGNALLYNITPTFMSHSPSTTTASFPSASVLPSISVPAARALMSGVNESDISNRLGDWKWVTTDRVSISVMEKMSRPLPLPSTTNEVLDRDIALVHGRIELTDSDSTEDLRLEFEGVHFISNGSIYGFAEPPGRRIDIRMLPSLVPPAYRNKTARALESEINARIAKLRSLIDSGVIEQESNNEEAPPTTCPFEFYGQIEPREVPKQLMEELEEELQHPTGIWTVHPPKLQIGGVLLSRECGMLIEMKEAEGLRSRTFFRKVTSYAGLSSLFYLGLIVLFARQTAISRTPAGLSRLSRWTFLAQGLVDAVAFAGHITFAVLAEGRVSLGLAAPAFLAAILSVYETQFALLIHQIQIPEEVVVPPPRPAPASAPPAASQATVDPNPAPSQPAAPTTPPSPTSRSLLMITLSHIRSDPHARLWLVVFAFMMLTVRVVLSPPLALLLVSGMYSSFWGVQIVRAVRRGRSGALTREYLLGTTMCRLWFVMYYLGCPKNVLDVDPRSLQIYLLAIFMFIEIGVLSLQDSLGPAFFLPQRYSTIERYNYHPQMPPLDPQASEQTLGDCAICMDSIVLETPRKRRILSKSSVDVNANGGGEEDDLERGIPMERQSLFGFRLGMGTVTGARKNYSLAPCHHLFHTECLERWLAIKNICPHCRRPLPPL